MPKNTGRGRGGGSPEDDMQTIIEKIIMPVGIFLLGTGLLLAVRGIALRSFSRWAERTETKMDDIVLASLRGPSIFWAAALGIYLAVQFIDFPQSSIKLIDKVVSIILIFSVTLAAANLSGRIFKSFIRQSGLPLPTTGLAYGLLKGVILALGLLMILGVLGISIAPLIAALGVGGIAVALALQDTLSNLFSGMHIMVEKAIRVGDFIRLETGQEGYVDDITWRTTRVRMLSNNIVVLPNSKLAQSVVINYHLPEKRMSLLIPVNVSYAADPVHIERILVEVAKSAVGRVPGLLGEPEPFVRFIPGFGDSALEFTLICQVQEFTDQYLAQHDLRKSIFKRFREEGIEIPFPQRTVHLRREKEERS
jgi:small-conductance mechanosensitive channel